VRPALPAFPVRYLSKAVHFMSAPLEKTRTAMESGGLASIFLGVTSAANFGISDFLGGLTSRRIRTVSVLITSQFVVMITLVLLMLVTSDRLPSWLEGILAFVAGCLSIAVGNLLGVTRLPSSP
jgi:hypothetical protein